MQADQSIIKQTIEQLLKEIEDNPLGSPVHYMNGYLAGLSHANAVPHTVETEARNKMIDIFLSAAGQGENKAG